MLTQPRKTFAKLGPVRRGIRAFRLACTNTVSHDGRMSYIGWMGGIAAFLIFVLPLSLSAFDIELWSVETGHFLRLGAYLWLLFFVYRPTTLPLDSRNYWHVDRILSDYPDWAPQVASWIQANGDHLDGRHLRSLRRAYFWRSRWDRWTQEINEENSGHARALMNGKMAGLIDQETAQVAQATLSAATPTVSSKATQPRL